MAALDQRKPQDFVDARSRADLTRELIRQLADATDPSGRDFAVSQLVDLYAPVVASLARRYGGRGVEFEELRQVGYVGLMKAINGYQLDRGDLMPYAVSTILGEIKRYFRDRCWAIRPTRRVQELEMRLVETRAQLQQDLGSEPTLAQLADRLGEEPRDVTIAAGSNALFRLVSTDAAVGDADSHTVGESIGGDDSGYERAEASAMISAAVATCGLSERDRQILTMRFFDDMTQREIAAVMGTSQMQVSRSLTRILGALRSALGTVTS